MASRRSSMVSVHELPISSNYDSVLGNLGLGRWQAKYIVALVVAVFQLAPSLIGSTFQNAPVQYRCLSSSYDIDDHLFFLKDSSVYMEEFNTSAFNDACFVSTELFPGKINDTFKYTRFKREAHSEDSLQRSRRFALQETSRGQTVQDGVPCVAWEYDNSTFTSTFTTEFDLVCHRAHLRPLYQMVFSTGYAVGDLFGGVLTDRIGRRSTFIFGATISILTNFLLYLIPDYLLNLILRFLIALSATLLFSPLVAATSENTPGRYRSLMVVLSMGVPYSISIFFYSALAYFVREWRLLQLAFSIPALMYIPFFFLMDESPRWLVMQNRHDDAIKTLENASRLNKTVLPPREILKSIMISMQEKYEIKAEIDPKSQNKGATNKTFLETFKTLLGSPVMRRITLITPVVWFLQGLVYLGIPLNVHNFSGSPFVYVALTAVAELPSGILSSPLTSRFGRIKVLLILFIISGICSLLGPIVPEDLGWLRWILMMVGMAGISSTFLVSYVHVTEMFPTCVRGQGTALCAFVGHLGYILAPFVTDVLSEINPIVPSIVFGTGGIVAGLLMPFLPETNNLPLCEAVEDVEDRAKTIAPKSPKKDRTLSQVITDAQIGASIPQSIGFKSNDQVCCVIKEVPLEEVEAAENAACEEINWSTDGNRTKL